MEPSTLLYITFFFIAVNKLLDYTKPYHKPIVSHLTTSESQKHYSRLLKEKLKLQEEQRSISAQDHYAKWTKNNRRMDNLDKELDSLKKKLREDTEAMGKRLRQLKLVALTLPFFVLKIWKGKNVVYYLPAQGMFPKFIEGVWSNGWGHIAFTPLKYLKKGDSNVALENVEVGVSLGIWCWAVLKVINTIEFVVKTLFFDTEVLMPMTQSPVD